MNEMIAGAISGLLVAAVFVLTFIMIMFTIVKERTRRPETSGRLPLSSILVFAAIVFAYPGWAIIGVIAGIIYSLSVEHAPGAGLGSPNLFFTFLVLVVTFMIALPVVVLLRRFYLGILATILAIVGLFGWFLPYFAE